MGQALASAHHAECSCKLCEESGGGYFAQRAFLAGRAEARDRLSPAVASFLAIERKRRAANKMDKNPKESEGRKVASGAAAGCLSFVIRDLPRLSSRLATAAELLEGHPIAQDVEGLRRELQESCTKLILIRAQLLPNKK